MYNLLYASLFFLCGWLVVLRINVDLAIFQPYLDLEAGDNQSLKIQMARPGIEPRSSCSASQELNHSATAAPFSVIILHILGLILTRTLYMYVMVNRNFQVISPNPKSKGVSLRSLQMKMTSL